jgi:hypothetical protein
MTVAAIKITDDSTVRVLRVPSALAPVKVLKTREQGPAGPPGATLPPIPFAYDDASPRPSAGMSKARTIVLPFGNPAPGQVRLPKVV